MIDFMRSVVIDGTELELVSSGDKLLLHAKAVTADATGALKAADIFFTFDLANHQHRAYIDDLAVQLYDQLTLSGVRTRPIEQTELLPGDYT